MSDRPSQPTADVDDYFIWLGYHLQLKLYNVKLHLEEGNTHLYKGIVINTGMEGHKELQENELKFEEATCYKWLHFIIRYSTILQEGPLSMIYNIDGHITPVCFVIFDQIASQMGIPLQIDTIRGIPDGIEHSDVNMTGFTIIDNLIIKLEDFTHFTDLIEFPDHEFLDHDAT